MARTRGRGWGRPKVRNRRDDRLANLDPLEFERVVADYYRRQGYTVEHCGTGGGGRRFDGGIDLKMYRGGEYTIVQCKRENALQVTHNVGHELLGVLMTERADHALVVNAGEFTPAAWTAAAKNPQLELIDGDRLREMLPEYAVSVPRTSAACAADRVTVDRPGFQDWSLSAPNVKPAPLSVRSLDDDDRWRRRSRTRRRRKADADAVAAGAKAIMAVLVVMALLMWQCSRPATPPQRSVARPAPTQPQARPATNMPATRPITAPVRDESRVQVRPPRPPDLTWTPAPGMTPQEIREAQRRADEAIKVIEAHTPEMVFPPERR